MTDEQKKDAPRVTSLEHTDNAESKKQLWWTVGALVLGLIVISLFYGLN